MKIHVNTDEFIVRCDEGSIEDLRERAQRANLPLDEALMAVAQPHAGWGAYVIGSIDWEDTLMVIYAESGFPMSAMPLFHHRHQAQLTLLGLEDELIEVRHYGDGSGDQDSGVMVGLFGATR